MDLNVNIFLSHLIMCIEADYLARSISMQVYSGEYLLHYAFDSPVFLHSISRVVSAAKG